MAGFQLYINGRFGVSTEESMQSQLRRVTRQRGAFPTPESAKKVLYLALERISKRWSRPIRDWVAALNHFAIVFEDRIPL